MKKWYVIIGILAFLLVVSVAGHVYNIHRVAQLENEAYEAGYQEGYAKARSYWLDAGYDVGHYDGWWTGYLKGYDDGTEYGLFLAGENTQYSRYTGSEAQREWRERWRDSGIYDKGYSHPTPSG
jgi:hypothetical protein